MNDPNSSQSFIEAHEAVTDETDWPEAEQGYARWKGKDEGSMGCGRKLGPYNCCEVYCCDCLEAMKQLPDGCVDAVITDPPYGVGVDYGPGKDADYSVNWLPHFEQSKRVSNTVIWSPGTVNMVEWICATKPDWIGAWHKSNQCSRSPLGFGAWEPICFYWKGKLGEYQHLGQDAWSIPIKQQYQAEGHPCPKLLEFWILLIANDVETILDPFLGSGTTAVAAKKLGRHFLGFEISEEYCRIARERIALVEMQPNLFEKQPEQMKLEADYDPIR